MPKKKPRKPGHSSAEACELPTPVDERPTVRIAPVEEKIGEPRDNLTGRGEWFKGRTEGKK